MTIGERIKERRTKLGLSADELAEKLGKNRATIYRYESNDINNMPITVLEPLAKALRTTPAELMGWGNEEEMKETAAALKANPETAEFMKLFQALPDEKKLLVISIMKGFLNEK